MVGDSTQLSSESDSAVDDDDAGYGRLAARTPAGVACEVVFDSVASGAAATEALVMRLSLTGSVSGVEGACFSSGEAAGDVAVGSTVESRSRAGGLERNEEGCSLRFDGDVLDTLFVGFSLTG